jgi:hypothetical protein
LHSTPVKGRREILLAARWDAFHLERALWTFRTKGDKPHVLGADLREIAAHGANAF